MTMASRDIANMHLFLDLKKKFPHLPDDTLRKHVSLYAEDQEKCLSLLQKESAVHHPSHDFRFSETKPNSRKNENLKIYIDQQPKVVTSHFNVNSTFDLVNESASCKKTEQPLISQSTPHQSSSHNEISNYAIKSVSLNVPSRPEQHSAPVLANYEKPFSDIYKQIPVSSHTIQCQIPIENDNSNRMMFSTTKEHTILPPMHSSNAESSFHIPASPEREKSKRHAVELSITPSFPFQQHQINVFNNAMTASASHSSRPGRHTTSVNFQLQPHPSDQYPLEISTVPSNIGDPCNYPDFGSHVQISVGSQGATFTALRLQRPYPAQNLQPNFNASHLPTDQSSQNFSKTSSQVQNSKACTFPTKITQESGAVPKNAFVEETTRPSRFERYPFFGESIHYHGQAQDSFRFKTKGSEENSKAVEDLTYHRLPSSRSIEDIKCHQIAGLDFILEELEKVKAVYSKVKLEVNSLEQAAMQKRQARSSFSYTKEMEKLREENRKLRIDCKCLLMDVDQYSTGQIPLGMIDEDFYSNIFTGPNGALTSPSKKAASKSNKETLQAKPNSFDDDDDEQARWRCTKCTFANHPALEKCEMCELPKDMGFVDCNSNYSPSANMRLVSSPEDQPRRAVGSVQISVTRRVPSSSKSVKLQLTHRMPR